MIITQQVYNGPLIKERFAYRFIGKKVNPVGDIVAFRAPMYVSDDLIDLEDSLTKDFIYSEDAINFCWEIPNLDKFGAVAFQRWFNINIATILSRYIDKSINMKGDDLMVQDNFIGSDKVVREVGKCSVSITYSKDNVAIGHTGINIRAGKQAPGFAYSTNMSDAVAISFMEDVISTFYREINDIFVATSKVIV